MNPIDEDNHLKGKATISPSDQTEESPLNSNEFNDAHDIIDLILNQENNQAQDQVQSPSQDNSSAPQHKSPNSSLNIIVNDKAPTQLHYNVHANGTKPKQGSGEATGTQQNNGSGVNQQQNQFP
ncbi:hypothetical protein KY285_023750 [Solanum tuberosum]|nr:hypothetical protein KY289_024083 [Solanum tuberosum]KAH0675949.1 hypothetical protein KY285_023750 [Solanum tuberosum]